MSMKRINNLTAVQAAAKGVLMEHSPEELLKKLNRIYEENELVSIVNQCESPSAAEEIAAGLEYPTSLLRETRYAGILKRDFPEIYNGKIRKVVQSYDYIDQKNRTRTKYFSCGWGNDDSYNSFEAFESLGVIAITPHLFLPPVFWEYELTDNDTGNIIFSHTDRKMSSRGRVYVLITEGSRSIPVGLKICANGGNLLFQKSVNNNREFLWQSHGREYFKVVCDEAPLSNITKTAAVHLLSNIEKELYIPSSIDKSVPEHHLVLKEELQYPAEESRNMLYSLETRYLLPGDWKTKSAPPQFKRAKKALFMPPDCWGDKKAYSTIFTAVRHTDFSLKRADNLIEFRQRVDGMQNGTPTDIDFLKTIDNFFSFKINGIMFHVFNEGQHVLSHPLVELGK